MKGKNGIYKRGDSWVARVEFPRDGETGERQRMWTKVFPTRKEAEEERTRLLLKRHHGVDVKPSKFTVGELMDRYLGDPNPRRSRGEKTLERYYELSRLHIAPKLGGILVRNFKKNAALELYEDLRKKGARGGCGLAALTIHHVHVLLKGALSWAVDREIIERNPLTSVIGPQAAAKESRRLTPDEAARILELAAATHWRSHIEILLATGLRRGELLGLRWPDCDFERQTATVRSSLSDANGVVKLKGTKTDKTRTVPLSALALEALRRQRVAQARERLAAGAAYDDQGFVFADPLGSPTVPDNLTKAFASLAKRAGIKGVTLHSTRHSTATWLLSAGADVHSVQTILGHSVPSTTLNIYGHAVAGLQAKAVTMIDDNLRSAQELRRVAGEQG
jgi:integrase